MKSNPIALLEAGMPLSLVDLFYPPRAMSIRPQSWVHGCLIDPWRFRFDGLPLDRPAGTPRNSLHGPGTADLDLN